MDIAKYITTAVILTSVFGQVENFWLVLLYSVLAVIVTLAIGLLLVREKK